MDTEKYDLLMQKLPDIAEAVNAFESEGAQVAILKALISALGREVPGTTPDAEGAGRPPRRSDEDSPDVSDLSEDAEEKETPNDIVNRLKQREDYPELEKEILHARLVWPKVQLILWAAKQPMTSGEIAKVLKAFGLKTDYSTVSHKLSDNTGSVIMTEARKKGANPGYDLTAPAKAEFEQWLENEIS